jgi:hypothetical protein
VDFQASQWGNRDDVRFTLNLWVGVPELTLAGRGGEAQIQQRIGALMSGGEDHWWPVDAATDVLHLAAELRDVLAAHGLPWLDARSGFDRLLSLAREDPDEFPRFLLGRFAMLLDRAGYEDVATEIRRGV